MRYHGIWRYSIRLLRLAYDGPLYRARVTAFRALKVAIDHGKAFTLQGVCISRAADTKYTTFKAAVIEHASV